MKLKLLIGVAALTTLVAPIAASAQSFANGSTLYSINLSSGALTAIGEVGDGESIMGVAVQSADGAANTAYALTTENELLSFNVKTPGDLLSKQEITGLPTDETLIGIDIRPATGVIFAISDSSVVYSIGATIAQATAVAGQLDPMLESDLIGFDFNPTVDRIRVIGSNGQNLRLNPDTGKIGTNPDTGNPTIDGREAYAMGDAYAGSSPSIVAAAYTNNVPGAEKTQLYVIDSTTNTLALQNPPNDGTLNTVGPLGVDAAEWAAFDIAPTGEGFVILPGTMAMPSTGAGAMTGTTDLLLPTAGMIALLALAGGYMVNRRAQ
ncbi:hypothetical protein BH09CHL1_BH09CHL1_32060 [soil metagenome]